MPEDPENRDFSIEKSVDKAGVRRAYVDIFNWKKVMKSSDSSDSSDSSAKRSKSLPAFKLFLSKNCLKAGKDLSHFMRLFGYRESAETGGAWTANETQAKSTSEKHMFLRIYATFLVR